jgi:hypothetical protein
MSLTSKKKVLGFATINKALHDASKYFRRATASGDAGQFLNEEAIAYGRRLEKAAIPWWLNSTLSAIIGAGAILLKDREHVQKQDEMLELYREAYKNASFGEKMETLDEVRLAIAQKITQELELRKKNNKKNEEINTEVKSNT